MTLDDQAQLKALQQIHKNSTIGMAGQLVVIFLTFIILYDYIAVELLFLGVLSHLIVFYYRIKLYKKFDLIQYKISTKEDLYKWTKKYKTIMLFSGLAFGLLLPTVSGADTGIHFLVVSILVGISAGAIYTVGEIFSIYIKYLLGIILPSILWMSLRQEDIYITGVLLMIFASGYYAMISVKYSENFKKIFLDAQTTKKQLAQILEQKDTLDHKAHYDDLTELPNKLLFKDRLLQGIEKAKRNKSILAVCFINLDNFKIINETLGHNYGDRVLKDVTLRLKEVLRSQDTLARWAGDEFILSLEDIDNENDAALVAQKVIDSLHEPFLVDMDTYYVTCSVGISLFPRDTDDVTHLIKYSDSAMYKAKNEGKNNYKFYSDDMTKMAFERVVMEASLRAAISNEEFVVYYQPQIDAKNKKLIGMEALVRWDHPTIGIIPPYRFIPLAEETGLIVGVDTIVMKQAMKQFSLWYKEGYNPGVLSLNLATKNLEEDNYIDNLKENIDKFCLDSSCLELELLESDIMKKPEEAVKKLQAISDLGIKIALDDFGTGYSSLSYLKKFPLNKLKIDKSFIDDIPHDEDGKAIVKVIIALGKSLNLTIIAEGVENESQKDFLLESGCDNIQGYFYAKPMPAEDMEIFMKEWS